MMFILLSLGGTEKASASGFVDRWYNELTPISGATGLDFFDWDFAREVWAMSRKEMVDIGWGKEGYCTRQEAKFKEPPFRPKRNKRLNIEVGISDFRKFKNDFAKIQEERGESKFNIFIWRKENGFIHEVSNFFNNRFSSQEAEEIRKCLDIAAVYNFYFDVGIQTLKQYGVAWNRFYKHDEVCPELAKRNIITGKCDDWPKWYREDGNWTDTNSKASFEYRFKNAEARFLKDEKDRKEAEAFLKIVGEH